MVYLDQEITIEREKVFGELAVSVERVHDCDDNDDAEIPFLIFADCYLQRFMDQEFTDILIKVIALSGVAYSLAAHRVVLTAMTTLKDRMKNGDQTIELHGIYPRYLFHLVAYAYASLPDALIFGNIILPGEDDTNRHSLPPTEFHGMRRVSIVIDISTTSGETDDFDDKLYLKK
ncbi:hypothetical protein TWF173_004756 [Orbilia oligospora]|nr:hypothetical protein TWF173_004756 [Orbilia oligospora]